MGATVTTLERARELSAAGNVVPVVETFVEDTETPVSAFLKLRDEGPCFLLESAEQGGRLGRYSFLGFSPHLLLRWSETRPETHAILRGERSLRIGPGSSFDPAGPPLAASSELRVVERREADAASWIRVEGGGAAGWLEREAALVY